MEYYKKLLKNMGEMTVPVGMDDRIMLRIEDYAKRSRLIKSVSFGVASMFSLVLSVPLFINLVSRFFSSGLTEIISVITSDWSLVIPIWKDFGLSILESVPIFSASMFMIVFFVFLFSVGKFIVNLKFNNQELSFS